MRVDALFAKPSCSPTPKKGAKPRLTSRPSVHPSNPHLSNNIPLPSPVPRHRPAPPQHCAVSDQMNSTSDNVSAIASTLTRLVSLHVPNERVGAATQVCARLLESTLKTMPSLQTAEAVSHAMLFRLVRDGRHEESTRLAELTAGLRFERGVAEEGRWGVLYVLNELRGEKGEAPRGIVVGKGREERRREQAVEEKEKESDTGDKGERKNVVVRNSEIEERVCRDLVLVVQGLSGEIVRFDGDGEVQICMPQGTNVTTPVYDVVKMVGEVGWLFRNIERCRQESYSVGIVGRNLWAGITSELDRYYRGLVTMGKMEGGLTLRRVLVWGMNERNGLRTLARIGEETRGMGGGEIAGYLSRAGRGMGENGIWGRLRGRCGRPLWEMLERWLGEGVVAKGEEFFVKEEEGEIGEGRDGGVSERIWWGRYSVRKEQLGGVGLDTAEMAVKVGKGVALLRRCCGDKEWVEGVHRRKVRGIMEGGEWGEGVRGVVKESGIWVGERVKKVFYEGFGVMGHFEAIRGYVLLGRGDFAGLLMDAVEDVLDKGDVVEARLMGLVDMALMGCAGFVEERDEEVRKRLDVAIRGEGGEKDGWEVFCLTYSVNDAPLNTVFSGRVMEAYGKIFKLLWGLRRMRRRLGRMFLRLGTRKKGREKWMRVKLGLLRMKLENVVSNVEEYCAVEVLESEWKRLKDGMDKAEDLDGMIDAHARYLTRIKDRVLLSERAERVRGKVKQVEQLVDKVDKLIMKWENDEDMDDEIDLLEEETETKCADMVHEVTRHAKLVKTCAFLVSRLTFNAYWKPPHM